MLRRPPIKLFFVGLGTTMVTASSAQVDTAEGEFRRGRAAILALGSGAAITGSLIALNNAWYDQYERTSFHTFDDGGEWMGMDKVGHLYSCYTVAGWGHDLVRWTGAGQQAQRWIGGTVGLAYMTAIEVMDGHSEGWGFSWWDMAANVAGTGLFIGQDLAWNEQRFQVKFSAHLTPYAEQRPDLLGSSTAERVLKDYNGQTYWLCGSPGSFRRDGRWPSWLGIAVGYGAEGMVSAYDEAPTEGDANNDPRYAQIFLSADLDLTRLPVKNKTLRTVLRVLNCVKVPAPALEWKSDGGITAHWLYF